MRDLEEIVLTVCRFFNRNKVPYAIIGGVTLSIWGAPRATQDVDIIVDLRETDVNKIVNFFKKNRFEIDRDTVKLAIKEGSHFTIFDEISPFRVDIKPAFSESDFRILRRRVLITYKRVKLYVWSPEDAIAYKLYSRSSIDLEDVKSILARLYGTIDMRYLEDLCKKLRVKEKMKTILKEVERALTCIGGKSPERVGMRADNIYRYKK